METNNIVINNDGLTGRLCNPHNKETNYSTWFRFEQNILSYPVITDTPLVPGSVHKISGLLWQVKLFKLGAYTWRDSTKSEYDSVQTYLGDDYSRQAYQLIEEPLQESKLCHNLRFDHQFGDAKNWIKFRKANMNITKIFWFTLSPVIDVGLTLYNPKCHIMIIIN